MSRRLAARRAPTDARAGAPASVHLAVPPALGSVGTNTDRAPASQPCGNGPKHCRRAKEITSACPPSEPSAPGVWRGRWDAQGGQRRPSAPQEPPARAPPLSPTCFLAQSPPLPLHYFRIFEVLAPRAAPATPKSGSETAPRASATGSANWTGGRRGLACAAARSPHPSSSRLRCGWIPLFWRAVLATKSCPGQGAVSLRDSRVREDPGSPFPTDRLKRPLRGRQRRARNCASAAPPTPRGSLPGVAPPGSPGRARCPRVCSAAASLRPARRDPPEPSRGARPGPAMSAAA